MIKFFKGVLSESDGTPSSRRLVMFVLTALFVGVIIFNLMTGRVVDPTLGSQLFYLLVWIFSVVLLDKVAPVIKAFKSGTEPGGDRPKNQPPNP